MGYLILFLLALIALWYFWSDIEAIAGKVTGGGSATRIVETWATAPDSIEVGVEETFVLYVQNNNPVATPQLTNVIGRHYVFEVAPMDNFTIVSVTPSASAPNSGSTNGAGQITVVIKANTLPDVAEGQEVPTATLVGIPPADTNVRVETSFTVTN